MCGVSSLTELRDPLLCLSFLWNSPLISVAAMVAQNPFSFPPARKIARVSIGFLVAVAQSQATLRLMPTVRAKPPKSRRLPLLWAAPHFESPLQSACLQCTVQNPQVIGFCIMSRICSCYHWEAWSIGSLYIKMYKIFSSISFFFMYNKVIMCS